MTGYTEILTDPSYRGEIMVFSSPTIANYRWSEEAMESGSIQVSGAVTRDSHSVLRGGYSLDEILKKYDVPGIDLVDTRTLILKIRESGVMRGVISDSPDVPDAFMDTMEKSLVSEVVSQEVTRTGDGSRPTCLLIDTGAKRSLVRKMSQVADLIIVPYNMDPAKYYGESDFVFLPNGPGDPAHESLSGLRRYISTIAGEKPLIGVCLGHQIISLASGCRTYKMKYGHRGSNHAVTDGRRTWISSHNHGYAVSADSLHDSTLSMAQWDINDGTVEMVRNEEQMILATQYHPEGAPGSHDLYWFFDLVRKIVEDSVASR